jgi:hypothetical protein
MNDSEYDDAITKAAQDALVAQQEDAPKDILDEVPEVPEEAPVDPEEEKQRIEALEDIARAVARGDLIPKTTQPPLPDPGDVAGYYERNSRPDWEFVNRQVSDYVALLPSEEAEAITTNHRAYNEIFDRFAEANRPAQPSPPPSSRPAKEIIDKILAARESRKDAARSESAGTVTGGSEAFGGGRQERSREQEMAALKLRIRRDPSNADLQRELAKFYLGDD